MPGQDSPIFTGKIQIKKDAAALKSTIELDAVEGIVFAQSVTAREVTARSEQLQNSVRLDGNVGRIYLGKHLGSRNEEQTIQLDGQQANLKMGGKNVSGNAGVDGDILLFAANGDRSKDEAATIHLDAGTGNLALGGNGQDGDILIFPQSATISTTDPADATIHLDGEKGLALKYGGKTTLQLDPKAGDIILSNADCAEDFDISVLAAAEPGTVMVIDREGSLRPSTEAYDKKVAGVISGAGDLKPGMVLDRQPGQNNRMPVALMGKVYCKVDAQYAPIEVGDLLTTSPTPGHAMKATDPTKAFGTVIGKALRSLKEGQGLVPILIALQ